MTDCELSRKWRKEAEKLDCSSVRALRLHICADELDRWLADHDAQIRAEAVAGAFGIVIEVMSAVDTITHPPGCSPCFACTFAAAEKRIRALTDKDAANWLAREKAQIRLDEHEKSCTERFNNFGNFCGDDWMCKRRIELEAELERSEAELARGRG